ncbi:hypothetical protein [Pseudocalidococcus azoricus]|uniref:hypothetical protein n=1 Tax=Pseudocalidococcus azoricus TaxID=3110322 RepID=UPI003899E0C9
MRILSLWKFPQLKTCYSQGETIDELMGNMREVIELCLDQVVTIPLHSQKNIGKGLLLKILRDAEITKDELLSLLE